MTLRCKAVTALAVFCLCSSAFTERALALTDEEVFRVMRFNFLTPGARALGMGGAFIGVANDATVAVANPAGLTTLTSAQLFGELRSIDAESEVLPTSPLGFNFNEVTNQFDSTAGTVLFYEPDTVTTPSFLAFTKPFGPRDELTGRAPWAFGLSRDEMMNSDIRVNSLAAFDKDRVPSPSDCNFLDPVTDQRCGILAATTGRNRTEVNAYSLSLAYGRPSGISFGVSVGLAELNMTSRVDNSAASPTGLSPTYATRIDDQDTDLAYSVGIQYIAGGKFSIGLVYRVGPTFEVQEFIENTAGNPLPGDPSVALDLASDLAAQGVDVVLQPDGRWAFTNTFKIPDQLGLGLGFLGRRFAIALDVVRVAYSDLEDDFIGRVNRVTRRDSPNAPRIEYSFDDELSFRLGFEIRQSLDSGLRLAYRLGARSEPDVRLDGEIIPVAPGGAVNLGGVAGEDFFQGTERYTHFSAGFGMTFNDRFRFDLAGDYSELDTTFVASFIYQFGGGQ